MKVTIVYGSTTGNTERVAEIIKENLSAHEVTLSNVTACDNSCLSDADLVLFGSSTWGYGDLQDDFAEYIETLDNSVLAGKNVAVFGCGDEEGFGEVFCNATEIIKTKVEELGGNIITANLKISNDPEDSMAQIIEFAQAVQ
ncbi:MAG: flavodoxin [Erysipelotrichaceae bacterium]